MSVIQKLVGVLLVISVVHQCVGLQCYECATMSGLGVTSCEKKDDLKDGFLKNCTGVCAKGVVQLEKKGDKGYFRGCMPSLLIKPEEVGTCEDLKLKDNMEILRFIFSLLGIVREPDPPGDFAFVTRCFCNDKDGCNSSRRESTASSSIVLFGILGILGMRLLV